MITNPVSGSRDASNIAEYQMRNWAMQMETQRHLDEQAALAPPQKLFHPCITISRETGVDAGEIAKRVAAPSKWKVLDREILDKLAESHHWSRVALEYVDEHTASWFHETFCKFLDPGLVSQGEYILALGKLVLMAAQHETTVFVGRGAALVLPRKLELSVRIIAPKKLRIERIVERRHCNRHEAEQFIDHTDSERARFVKRYFHHDVADPKLYDLVINLEFTSHDGAAQLVLSDFKSRFGS